MIPCGTIAAYRSYSRQSHSQYRDSWHEVPPVRQPRRVLINLQAVRPLMTAVHGDTMDSTTCRSLPSLGRLEEYALFTYNVLIHPYHTETLTVNILLYYISQQAHHIYLGSLLGAHLHGSSLARQHWRHLRPAQ